MNVVFEDNSSAKALLNALTPDEVDKELIPELTERDAKQYDKSKPEIEFKVRMTRWDDKKVKNASQYSRYYLLNPDAEKRTRRERRTGGGYRDREHRARRPIADDEDLFPNKVTADDFYGERREESKEGSDKSGDLLNRITIKSSKGSDDLLSRIGTPDKSSTKKGDDNDLLSRLN